MQTQTLAEYLDSHPGDTPETDPNAATFNANKEDKGSGGEGAANMAKTASSVMSLVSMLGAFL